MPILIRKSTKDENHDWSILELQGDIKSHSESNLENQFIGDLHFTKSGVPILIIGHHLLYGKEVPLEKPFVVLEKKTEDHNTEYIVKTIIRKRIIFKTRPKPIVK
ncbi:chromosome transmission fidelity protein 8 homolog [Coccinella septempunctata]|uniref:chromosome transmission fidelity protein 8 homolog n=1 Tax=Coccinella septempunctata TaxID=41139 RepID=UPI001D096420|nr:chromosome transmission fidelity protein 8 homolog [Coccinella septempunctata]